MSAAGGHFTTESASGPRGEPVSAPIGIVPLANIPETARAHLALGYAGATHHADVAIIEMASVSGLALLATSDRDPWLASSIGTGELIRRAADFKVAAVLLGVGGSATHDLGLGALAALGMGCESAAGTPVHPPIPGRWREIERFRGRMDSRLPPIRIACDVTNPLLGPNGAAATYGPQKGLRPEDLSRLDHESARLALMLCNHCAQSDALMETPGAGAAGGIAFGLMTAAGARLLPGFQLVSAWLNLETRLAEADLVITGEGRFDASSLRGKGPGAVAARALALGKQVHVFAGAAREVPATPALQVHAISPPGLPLASALAEAPQHLARALAEAF